MPAVRWPTRGNSRFATDEIQERSGTPASGQCTLAAAQFGQVDVADQDSVSADVASALSPGQNRPPPG